MTKRRKKIQKLYPSIIFISILFMSIGYAIINSVILEIDGTALVNVPNSVFISQAKYIQRTDSLPNESAIINTHYNSTLSSTVKLEQNNSTSKVSIEVTFFNNTNKSYTLNDVSYNPSITGTYTNSNIKYRLEQKESYQIESKQTMNIIITFEYQEGAELTQNILNSILKFEFIEYTAAFYNYQGTYEFTAPETGTYKLETWGASGGDTTFSSAELADKLHMEGGNGGYSSGEIELTKGERIYIVVGGEGNGSTAPRQSLEGGYNGGGDVIGHETWNHHYGTGGGATHIARITGLLQDLYENKNLILLVAGGGGGSRNQYNNSNTAARYGNGGAGGGLKGIAAVGYGGTGIAYTCTTCASGQTGDSSLFGKGEGTTGNASGGGGFYGGYSGSIKTDGNQTVGSGGGGSGYIDGTLNGNSIAGNQPIPSPNGISSIIGKDGDGSAKISLLSSNETHSNANIQSINIIKKDTSLGSESAKVINFNGLTFNTHINLEPNNSQSEVIITLKVHNSTKNTYYLKSIKNPNSSTNSNIKYTYTNTPEALQPNKDMTVNITFTYAENADLTQSFLDALLSLEYSETKIISNATGNSNGDIIIFDTEQNSNGIVLNGTNSYANFENTTATEFPLTYSITFKTNETSGVLFGDYTTKSALGFIEKRVVINLSPPGTENRTKEYLLSEVLSTTEWNTFDVVYLSNTEQKLYLNGVEITNTTATGNYWVWGDSLSYIGTRPISAQYSTAYNFKGTVKRFMVYDKELTQEEIIYNYNASSSNIITDQLAIYYDFELKD